MKKLMVLGGSKNQLPLITKAKYLGHHVVLCDYAPDNIGKQYSDTFYCVSTLDVDAVLDVAKKESIDGIVTNSEPAMPVSAYVANALNLPANPYESIQILCRKDLFRKFLKKNGFNYPRFIDVSNCDLARRLISGFKFPLMVKPIDSSGSRGVVRIDAIEELRKAFEKAVSFSKTGRVMIEEYIEKAHDYMIGGDIFVMDGRVVFWGLMDSFRNKKISDFIPVGTRYPSSITEKQFEEVDTVIHRLLSLLQIQSGPFNVELMFNKNGLLYLIELNPRSGGNQIPEILRLATGVDTVEATVNSALGERFTLLSSHISKWMSTYVLHSHEDGVFKQVDFSGAITPHIMKIVMNKEAGDNIKKFDNAGELLGVMLMDFSSREEMFFYLNNMSDHVKITLA
ncbi:MAG: ATP-grasp domain-containing protein [Firmicutes bacterium]|nr:ATP-grasp domain-containing protein [Bacillota bacterium]